MKKVSFKRAAVCFLVLLSFVGACLSQLTVSAQERVSQESQVLQHRDSQTEAAQGQEAKTRKAKKDKGKINPLMICEDCDPGGGGGGGTGGGGGYTGDGHIWCDGWDRQGDCVFNHVSASSSVEFRRQLGSGGYHNQSFITWFPWETDGFGRFPVPDGNVGLVSTSPLAGQIPLYRWSTRKGFYYSVYYTEHSGDDYVYGGIAGYVWPAGDNRGFPLYQFYSDEYGHYYTNYKNEINCQPHVNWADQGEMARVNFPAPFAQAFRNCRSLVFPVACDPFARFRCEARGGFFNPGNCLCSDGLP
jgi:hypothetical protein